MLWVWGEATVPSPQDALPLLGVMPAMPPDNLR